MRFVDAIRWWLLHWHGHDIVVIWCDSLMTWCVDDCVGDCVGDCVVALSVGLLRISHLFHNTVLSDLSNRWCTQRRDSVVAQCSTRDDNFSVISNSLTFSLFVINFRPQMQSVPIRVHRSVAVFHETQRRIITNSRVRFLFFWLTRELNSEFQWFQDQRLDQSNLCTLFKDFDTEKKKAWKRFQKCVSEVLQTFRNKEVRESLLTAPEQLLVTVFLLHTCKVQRSKKGRILCI
jgi:hypothetical protein